MLVKVFLQNLLSCLNVAYFLKILNQAPCQARGLKVHQNDNVFLHSH
ncbi:MAG: hypothetical protein LBQ59_05360 [Candidatus Peribacteria bacterium]|nr:hypothetical protein [Candidatus Peribacteria bacterium]